MSNAKTLEPKTPSTPAPAGTTQNATVQTGPDKGKKTGIDVVRRGRNPVDPNESKDKKFRRLANKRVPKALKAIGYCKNLANSNQYEFTPEQANKIVMALQSAVTEVEVAFEGENKAADSFSL